MRAIHILFALGMIVLLPSALALQPVTVTAPDAKYTVRSETVAIDSSKYLSEAPVLQGEVQTQALTVDVHGPTCTLDPTAKVSGGKVTRCGGAGVQAPDASDARGLVDYKLSIGGARPHASAGASAGGVSAAAAAVTALVPSQGALIIATATGVSLLGLYALWRALKWTGLFAILPLYSHITDDEILDDANRAAIYRLIQQEVGISTKDIAERLDLAWGTVTHHLGKLEKRRFVVSKKYGKYRRYFANGEGGTEMKDQVAVLRLDRTGDVAALIRAQPGLTQKAVSQHLGVSSSTILWHVKRLESTGLITKVREGKLVRYYPQDGLGNVLVAAPGLTPTPLA